jgi:diaminopropionate ammonia-lyase
MRMQRYFINPAARSVSAYPALFGDEEYASVNAFHQKRPHLRPTPLRPLRTLAAEIGVGDVLVKDESARFGLNSFKVLGVSYAVDSLLSGGRLNKRSVLACATEGNHGRAVAHAARENELQAKIYVSGDTAAARIEALKGEGAQVVIVKGNYDEAVKRCAEDAQHQGWTIVSDTSWPGYEEIPRLIMAGYTRLLSEAEQQWQRESPPDVVLVQGGVGGLACAVVSWLNHRYGLRRPFVVVCEPATAACLLESARAGTPVSIDGPFNTIMAGLRCGVVSPLAWPSISGIADAFVAIDDEPCASAMRKLSAPAGDDPMIVAGAAGACGLAGLLAILQDESFHPLREASGLGKQSRVLVINTEGATDPELYAQIIGRSHKEIFFRA